MTKKFLQSKLRSKASSARKREQLFELTAQSQGGKKKIFEKYFQVGKKGVGLASQERSGEE